MDILAACREVGSYRGAAEICGTTHKRVRRVVERHNADSGAPARRNRGQVGRRLADLLHSMLDSVLPPGTVAVVQARSVVRACTSRRS